MVKGRERELITQQGHPSGRSKVSTSAHFWVHTGDLALNRGMIGAGGKKDAQLLNSPGHRCGPIDSHLRIGHNQKVIVVWGQGTALTLVIGVLH
jgi:hypothetical protein